MRTGILLKLKFFILAVVLCTISNNLIAQNNIGIFFQAVAKDNYSNPAKQRKIYVQSTIIQSSVTGNKVLIEEHQTNTDASGMFSIIIGNGTRVGGTVAGLTSIDWSNGPFYLNLKVAITPVSGDNDWDYTREWQDMGTTSFGAVPYSFYAAKAAEAVNAATATKLATPRNINGVGFDGSKDITIAANAGTLTGTTLAANVVNSSLTSVGNLIAGGVPYSLLTGTVPTWNQNTTGNAATATNALNANTANFANSANTATKFATSRNINGVSFDGSADITVAADAGTLIGKVAIANGGTGATTAVSARTNLGLGNVENTADADKPISNATQTALDTKISSATFSTTIANKANTSDVNTALNLKANTSDVNTALNLKANTSDVTTSLGLKAPINNPTFTGTVGGIDKTMVGLGNVNNTSDVDKPISNATQTALDTKVSSATFSTTIALKANTADVTTSLGLKAPINNPTFTGAVGGIDKTMVGLGNVNNTADVDKPISIATQTALDTKVSSATFSTTIATKANTTDVNTALNLKANINDVNTSLNLKLNTNDNAVSATKLATTRNINGVAFDGSADITIAANAGTLTGTTLAANVVNSSLTSVGTITSGTWSGTTIDVTKGGTGTNNGSITGTSALTFSAGGTNQNVSIKASGTGSVIVGAGTITPTGSAALDVNSNSQGFLPPRMTTAQRDAITNAVAGLTIWNSENKQLEVYDGSYWVNMNGKLVSTLYVGDSYGGGKVAYIFTSNDPGYIAGQTHGLIAANSDQTTDAGVMWFPSAAFYGATAISLGQGNVNTLSIIAAATAAGTTTLSSYAAGLANSYRDGKYTDWYLPSKEELNKLYINRDAIGGFAIVVNSSPYWSSSQSGTLNFTSLTNLSNGVSNAWVQNFSYITSSQYDLGKNNTRRVRAIRSF